jgi:hypothetical protein
VLTDRANFMLDAWEDRLIIADEIRSWAETELLAIADVASVPSWLLDLVQHGPQAVADTSHEWRRRPGFEVRFALRATRLNLDDRPSVEGFARWLRGAALGGDLAHPEVQLGYEVDHYLDDLGNLDLAVQCVREGLPTLLERCRATIAVLLG